MITPDYVKILKLDKLAMRSKTKADYVLGLKKRKNQAIILGVEQNFSFFADEAWSTFGTGEFAEPGFSEPAH
jgi:hypothetical protein